MKQLFSDIGQQSMVVILERRKINDMNPIRAPAYCLQAVSRLQYRVMKPKQSPGEFAETKATRIFGVENWSRGNYTEIYRTKRSLEIYRGVLQNLLLNTYLYMQSMKRDNPGESHSGNQYFEQFQELSQCWKWFVFLLDIVKRWFHTWDIDWLETFEWS